VESPQLENGYVRIATELYEQFLKVKLSDREHRVLGAIIRKTYGWNKKNDWISLSKLSELTGIKDYHCAHALTKLKTKNMITRKDGITGINKNFKSWLTPKQAVPNQALLKQAVPIQVLGSAQTGNQGVPKQADTIDKNYRHYTKDKTLSGSKPEPDPVCSEILSKLMLKVKAHRPNHKTIPEDKAVRTIAQMLKFDNRDPKLVIELLDWYPIGQPYIPEIFSASSLREKFEKLESAFNRKNGGANNANPERQPNPFLDDPQP
jgi:phage replication O-like protein O